MTWPSVLSDLLMLEASRSRSPAAPDAFCRSEPAQHALFPAISHCHRSPGCHWAKRLQASHLWRPYLAYCTGSRVPRLMIPTTKGACMNAKSLPDQTSVKFLPKDLLHGEKGL